ncbi:MAG: hypothetical protein FDX18_02505 [Chlorobium sp.]|nr:MAG: hypothetical protein FDX18_02505 [Chlorobium sp.]
MFVVLPERLVMIQLPQEVCPGRHELVIVLEEQASQIACLPDDQVEKLHAFIIERYELSFGEPVRDAEKIFTSLAARHAE